MLSAAAKHLARRSASSSSARLGGLPSSSSLLAAVSSSSVGAVRPFSAALEQFEDYGKAVFTGKVAHEYLAKHGAKGSILDDPTWVKKHADTVAMAVFDWYDFGSRRGRC